MHHIFLLMIFTSFSVLDPPGMDEPAEGSAGARYDCGSLSLFTLLRLEGHPAELRTIEGRLPPSTADGRSMAALIAASRELGLDLMGIRLTGASRPDRPVIAYLRSEDHGHFVAMRPVGHTGRLIQVFDGLDPPAVLDFSDYRQSPRWTGLVLIRMDAPVEVLLRKSLVAGVTTCLLAGIAGIAILVHRAMDRRRGWGTRGPRDLAVGRE